MMFRGIATLEQAIQADAGPAFSLPEDQRVRADRGAAENSEHSLTGHLPNSQQPPARGDFYFGIEITGVGRRSQKRKVYSSVEEYCRTGQ